MATVYGSPFKINWKDKDEVITYAKKLGKGMSVFKDEGVPNYGITHTSRTDLTSKEGRTILFRT